MVHLNYDSDDEGGIPEPASQKYHLRKPVTPYIASTPGDFEAEREHLTNEVFPRLADICKHRGTAFSPIDIKWTPDSEHAEKGHLLRINLDFILKCTPYFMCLLGETYGPHRPPEEDKLPDSLLTLDEDASWLDKNYLVAATAGYRWILKEAHQNCSIAELEIIQAAFLTDSEFCHFYYRQPEHLDLKCEGVSDEEKEALTKLHKPTSEYADLSIRDLKQRIVNKGLPVKYFRTKEELGGHVFSDWLEIINNVCPPLLDAPHMFDLEEYQEWLSHEVFAESRRQVYVNHSELRALRDELNRFCNINLDEPFIDEEPTPKYHSYSISSVLRKQSEVTVKFKSILAVRGERGSGKSSLAASWVKHYAVDNPEVKVIGHFVGASGRSRDIATFLRLCVTELRQEYLRDDNGGKTDRELTCQTFKELCESFHAALSLGPCVLLLDGVDELGASLGCSPQEHTFKELCKGFHATLSLGPCVLLLDGVDELGASLGCSPQEIKRFSWIPLPLPPQCKIVVTTTKSDYSHSSLSKRPDVQFVAISNVNTTKLKAELLEEHMQRHFDQLNRVHIQTVYETKLSGRPLFLKVMASEMSNYGVFTDLNVFTETIREMCTSVRDLYVRSIKRWSQEHSWTYEVLSSDQAETEGVEYIGWVPDVLRLLAVSRSGLAANEILEILQQMGYQENVAVTPFDWLQFRLCLGGNVTESPYGVINFSHQHLREVVEYILLRTVKPSTAEIISVSDTDKPWKKQKADFHTHLVHYFRGQPGGQRRSQELPWQLWMAGDTAGLKKALADPDLFLRLYDAEGHSPSNHYDLVRYWRHLETVGHSAVDTYRHLLIKLEVLTEDDNDLLEVQSVEETEPEESVEISASRSESTVSQIAIFTPTSPSVPKIYTTPASESHKLSVIEEASDIMSRDGKDDLRNSFDSVFLSQNLAHIHNEEPQFDLSPSEVTSLTWYIAQFLIELGHKQAGEKTLVALNTQLMQGYPLCEADQLIHASVQERLGRECLAGQQPAHREAERWYRRALKTVGDIFEIDEASPLYNDLQNLKCLIIRQIGFLRLEEGLLDSADDLLEEALEMAEVCSTLPTRATILYHIGVLRLKQTDHLMSETNLRKALSLRERWYGRKHPEVADILYNLGMVMADENYERGYDRNTAETMFRRCLEIRENHLEKDDLRVAQVLFELGKLLRCDRSYMGRMECQRVLRRAQDIRITQLGGDHIETRAVRQYLNNLETTLKSGKTADSRSSDRPYSSLSWRGNDLANLERRSRIQSGKSSSVGQYSRPASQISRTGSQYSHAGTRSTSRPVSGQYDYPALSPKSNVSYLPASERYLLESGKPRLLNRDSVERKLKTKGSASNSPVSPQLSPNTDTIMSGAPSGKHISVPVENEEDTDSRRNNDGVLLDSFASEPDKASVKFVCTPSPSKVSEEQLPGRDTPQERLFRRYGSPQGMDSGPSPGPSLNRGKESGEMAIARIGEQQISYREPQISYRSPESGVMVRRESPQSKPRRTLGSARSIGSSLYTTASATSIASSRSHKSSCDIPANPHSIHLSNARTTTMGPHSSLNSLMGHASGPRDISQNIHHKSAWYHVPGRYRTADKKLPSKRSQARDEAKHIKNTIAKTEPDPYSTFMKSDYRKNNPKNISANYPGLNGHTCKKGQLYPPYPKREKQYTICDKCQHEASVILATHEQSLLGIVEGSLEAEAAGIAPTVNGLTSPDRPRQVSYMIDEMMNPEEVDYSYPHAGTMVTFKDPVMMN